MASPSSTPSTFASPLQGIAIIEYDINNDLITWSFPILDKPVQTLIESRTNFSTIKDEENSPFEPNFRYSRYNNCWHYILNNQIPIKNNSKIVGVSIVLFSQTFNPIKYLDLTTKLIRIYLDTPTNPTIPILQAYLSIYTKNEYIFNNHKFVDSDYDNRKALIAPIKKTLNILGSECSILIWTAVLLKKRILIYNHKLGELLSIVRSIPCLGSWHRNNQTNYSNPATDILRPYVRLTEEAEINELNQSGIYIAGTTNSLHSNRSELYDLFIDSSNKNYIINENNKGDFQLTKFHKTTAETFLQAANTSNEETNDQTIIKLIAGTTKQLLDNILSLRVEIDGGLWITAEGLTEHKLPAAMEKFIFNVANAEGLTKK